MLNSVGVVVELQKRRQLEAGILSGTATRSTELQRSVLCEYHALPLACPELSVDPPNRQPVDRGLGWGRKRQHLAKKINPGDFDSRFYRDEQ